MGDARTKCPECTSQHVWKDGLRYTRNGDAQRYICRECGYRFSQTSLNNSNQSKTLDHDQTIHTNKSYRLRSYNINRRVSVALAEGTKNLVKVESRIERWAAGATKPDSLTIKGLIVQYAFWLEKEGYKSSEYINLVKRLLRLGANLLDPEDVKKTIAKQPWKEGTKMLAVYAYDGMAKMLNMEWSPPKYVQEENLPFVPEETELDQLVAGCRSRRMATFLQTLKETFADPGEVLRLRWINVSGNTITINDPVKRHNPRQLKVLKQPPNNAQCLTQNFRTNLSNLIRVNAMFLCQSETKSCQSYTKSTDQRNNI